MFSGKPEGGRRASSSFPAHGRRWPSRSASVAAPASGPSTPRPASPHQPPTSLYLSGAAASPSARSLSSLSTYHLSRGLAPSPVPPSRRAPSHASVASSLVDELEGADSDPERDAYVQERGRVLARDYNYVVVGSKNLPVEVQHVLDTADHYTDPLGASLDSSTGFAFLINRTQCFVWNWSLRQDEGPITCYKFQLPSPTSSLPSTVSFYSPLCQAAFVPTSTSQPLSREPGLVVVSTTGQIRFWDSISLALSDDDSFTSAQASFRDGEITKTFVSRGAATFIISTSHSRLFHVSLSTAGGTPQIAVQSLDKHLNWTGSVLSAVFGTTKADPRAGTLAVTGDSKFLYAVAAKNVQVWTVEGHTYTLSVNMDMFASILECFKGSRIDNEEWAINKNQVEVLDAKLMSTGVLAVLVSHVSGSTDPHALSYSIALLQVGTAVNSIRALGAKRIQYQTHSDPRPLSTPSLSLRSGNAAFVVFADAVVILSLSLDSDFEESFVLKQKTQRFLGFSTVVPSPTSSSLSLLTSFSEVLSVDLTGDLPETKLSENAKTDRIKRKIYQSIFFNTAVSDNPLSFQLDANVEGDLMAAAESVSSELLSSSSPNLPSILDLRTQIADRISRAQGLIDFINSSGLIQKLSQSCRRRLCWDAEKLHACNALWHYQSSLKSGSENLLSVAIRAYLGEDGNDGPDDPIRLFFRRHVSALGAVLGTVVSRTKSLWSSALSLQDRTLALSVANQIVITTLSAVNRYRSDFNKYYAVDHAHLPLESWTSTEAMLEGMQWLFEATDTCFFEKANTFQSRLDRGGVEDRHISTQGGVDEQALHAELISQENALANFLFEFHEERVMFLSSRPSSSSNMSELRRVKEAYSRLGRHVLRKLVSIGKVSSSFELAERYRDFNTLVDLCNHPKYGSAERIKRYMIKYGKSFVFPLFDYYLNESRTRDLLDQDELFQPLLTDYLESRKLQSISWINDISIARFEIASESLIQEAGKEQFMAKRKLLLSLGKLAEVAQADYDSFQSEHFLRKIEYVDDKLDIVNAQEALRDHFLNARPGLLSSNLSIAEQSSLTMEIATPSINTYPGLLTLFKRFSTQLLQGFVLPAEALVDIMTCCDSSSLDANEFVDAFNIIARLPEDLSLGRVQHTLKTAWRRLYLHDDWAHIHESSNLTDDELSSFLKSTLLYSVLANVFASGQSPLTHYRPDQCFFDASSDVLTTRFPDEPDLVNQLQADLEQESDRLRVLISAHHIDRYLEEIERLLGEPNASLPAKSSGNLR